MEQIDYKEKYEQALERARQFSEKPYLEDSAGIVEYIFPELKESEDERIRKALIKYFTLSDDNAYYQCCGVHYRDIVAWLEKKIEQNQKHFELKAGHWYICHRAFCCRADHLTVKEGERFMCEKDGVVKGFVIKDPEKYFYEVCAPAPIEDEQKSADKVEPKFKVSDWVVNQHGYIRQIIDIKDDCYYCIRTESSDSIENPWHGTVSYVDERWHKWSIEDAKAGDVLYDGSNACIFRKKMKDDDAIWVDTYCGINSDGIFNVNNENECWCLACDCIPATKEQLEQLEKAMADAGYTFDFEKKKLKKIEQSPAWSEADRIHLGNCIALIQRLSDSEANWLKSLKYRVLPKPAEWSEEDEAGLGDALWAIKQARTIAKDENDMGNLWYAEDWLKSLRHKTTWKPSEGQLKVLEIALNDGIQLGTIEEDILRGLIEQLKEL